LFEHCGRFSSTSESKPGGRWSRFDVVSVLLLLADRTSVSPRHTHTSTVRRVEDEIVGTEEFGDSRDGRVATTADLCRNDSESKISETSSAIVVVGDVRDAC
jgi:hypothetical protein